jgi:RNA polymerase sigma-32 factor
MWWIKVAVQEYILVKLGTSANQKNLFFNLRSTLPKSVCRKRANRWEIG